MQTKENQNKSNIQDTNKQKPDKERSKQEMKLTSTAFKEGEMIPSKYTCDADNVSPELSWTDVPKDTKSLALIVDDPDAPNGDWVHWVVYNIPPTVTQLKEKESTEKILDNGAISGTNDFKKTGYSGPCPPSGTHRYYFKLYAMNIMLDKKEGMTKKDLMTAMEGKIIAQGQLMGKYSKK